MADTELRDGHGFSMHIGGPEPVCIVYPPPDRTAESCEGLPIEKIPAGFSTDAMAVVRLGTGPALVTVKRVGDQSLPAARAEDAQTYADRHAKNFATSLPPPARVDLTSVRGAVVTRADGVASYEMVFDVVDATPDSPFARFPHQHQFEVPSEHGVYSVVWGTTQSSAVVVDALARKAAGTIVLTGEAAGKASVEAKAESHLAWWVLGGIVVVVAAGLAVIRPRGKKKADAPKKVRTAEKPRGPSRRKKPR